MRRYIYQCDFCKKTLSMPGDPGQSTEHLNMKGADLFFSHYSKKEAKWKQIRFNLSCAIPFAEHHFCNGKCMGRYVDQRVGEITKQIKE